MYPLRLAFPAHRGAGSASPVLRLRNLIRAFPKEPRWFASSRHPRRHRRCGPFGRRLMPISTRTVVHCAKLLHDNFGNKAIAERMHRDFEVVSINIWGDREVTDLTGASPMKRRSRDRCACSSRRRCWSSTNEPLSRNGSMGICLRGSWGFVAAIERAARAMERGMRGDGRGRRPAGWRPPTGWRRPHHRDHPQRCETRRRLCSRCAATGFRRSLARDPRPMLVMFEETRCAACDEMSDGFRASGRQAGAARISRRSRRSQVGRTIANADGRDRERARLGADAERPLRADAGVLRCVRPRGLSRRCLFAPFPRPHSITWAPAPLRDAAGVPAFHQKRAQPNAGRADLMVGCKPSFLGVGNAGIENHIDEHVPSSRLSA